MKRKNSGIHPRKSSVKVNMKNVYLRSKLLHIISFTRKLELIFPLLLWIVLKKKRKDEENLNDIQI